MKISTQWLVSCLALPLFVPALGFAQDPTHATEFRMQHPGNEPGGTPRIAFLAHRLGSDHAEGISLLDMNGDGFPDLLSGAYWYENPGAQGGAWKQHQFRTVGIHNEFVSDCGEWIVDVDHDGLPDVITAGWISNGLWWYRNPGPQATAAGTMWKAERITDSYDTEGGAFADINGDGKPDIALAHYNRSGVLWVDFSKDKPRVHHLGGREEDGHGIGIADINGDGKADVLTPHGWFEQIDADNDNWKWHGDWGLGDPGFPILGYDVNHDGKMDLIYGQGHGYGLYWLEQAGTPAHPNWVRHTIDESFSQSHALVLADIDGDGVPELLTGKRYRGHGGNDPGSYDPLVVYCYKIDRAKGEFTRYSISVNGTAGVGTQFVVGDLDKDGDLDFATAGKTGVHFFENLKIDRVPKETREKDILLNKEWPFEGEGVTVEQEDGPPQR